MRYEKAIDMETKMKDVVNTLNMDHVQFNNVTCIRSYGSTSNAIARCHALNKIMQLALERDPHYILEFISEKFDRMSEEDKIRVIIHELMHIPKAFGGGFRHHDFVTRKNVEKVYDEYKKRKNPRFF